MKQIRFYQIITAISCLFLISCGIEQNLKKADKHLSLGEYYDAATQYKKVYTKTPTKERAARGKVTLKMARCYDKINSTPKALAAYSNAIRYKQAKDLAKSQHDLQMSIWQDLLSRTGTIFNDMAEMVKNTSGESSAAYKTMFLVNQGISMAQARINTEVAATKAMAEGGFVMGIPMATAIRGLGYASVGMIAAQTITGMAHNGIDNIPQEGTWLLDGGERVLNPQQNKDLTNYLSNKGSSGGNIEVNVQVTDSGVTSQSNQTDQKQLGQLIGNAVRAVIMQEKRQGGLLSK